MRTVSDDSFLKRFQPSQFGVQAEPTSLSELAEAALGKSKSTLIGEIAKEFNELSDNEKQNFLERILMLGGIAAVARAANAPVFSERLPDLPRSAWRLSGASP